MKKAVIYARYSSDKQTEQSIEGQLYDCYNYAKSHGIEVVHEYIDRAMTGRNDDRPQFQQMIKDSAFSQWEYVLVWKLDRFARNTVDSAINRQKLTKNGVKIISAMESFGDDPSGQMMERIIEAINEYYSADLREKTVRGMRQSALKCNSTGGHIPIGYKIENKKYVIDERTRAIPETVFRMYAAGERLADIAQALNDKGYRTQKGNKFTKGSFYGILSNEKYIGVYHYQDIRIEGGYPQMIDKEIFDMVQKKLSENKKRAAKYEAKADYILSGKLFCGECGEPMSGLSGTSRSGYKYYYYRCNGVQHKRGCHKKNEPKEQLEKEVCKSAREAFGLLDRDQLAEDVCKKFRDDLQVSDNLDSLRKELSKAQSKAENATNAILDMGSSPLLTKRLSEIEEQIELLQSEIRISEQLLANTPTVEDVKKIIEMVINSDPESEEGRKWLIDIMIDKVYVYDDRLTIIFKSDQDEETIPHAETLETLENVCTPSALGSHEKNPANKAFVGFFSCLLNLV